MGSIHETFKTFLEFFTQTFDAQVYNSFGSTGNVGCIIYTNMSFNLHINAPYHINAPGKTTINVDGNFFTLYMLQITDFSLFHIALSIYIYICLLYCHNCIFVHTALKL